MDPIADFLNTLKMASRTGKESFVFPYSRFISAIVAALQKKGYITSFKKSKRGHNMEIALPTGEGAIRVTAARRISRLSKRMYQRSRDLRPVRNGSGVAVLSTPRGVLTDADAHAAKVGGEVLFEIW